MTRLLSCAALALCIATGGCCFTRPKPFVPPQHLTTESADPTAMANRILTSMLTVSPVATESMVRLQILPGQGLAPDSPSAQAMAHLREKLADEPNVRLVEDSTVFWQLVPSIRTSADGHHQLLVIMRPIAHPDRIVWQYHQSLD